MVNVTFANRTQTGCFHGRHRNGFASKGDKLYFVGLATFMDVDDRTHVTRFQIFIRQVTRQHHAIMFFDLHLDTKG